MKTLKKLTIISIFLLCLLAVVACTTPSNGVPAPKAQNLHVNGTKLFWESPEDNVEIEYELTFFIDGEKEIKGIIGTSYDFTKYQDEETIEFSLVTMPYGSYGNPSEAVTVTYTKPVHQHSYVNGECACGAKDPNYQPDQPHQHSYVNGKCACGAKDPNYVPEKVVEPIELTIENLGLGNYADGSATVNGINFEFIELGTYGNGIQWRNKGKASTLWNTTAFEGKIARIDFVYNAEKATYSNANALKIDFGTSSAVSSYTTYLSTTSGTTNYSITPNAESYAFVKFTINITYAMYFDSITIHFVGGGSSNPEQPHEHEYYNGECACGAKDPNYVPEQPGEDQKSPDGYVLNVRTGVPYILKLEHKGTGSTLYATGNMDGYYYETTSKLSESIVIYLEATTNGYYVYHLKNDTKIYLDIIPSGTHINVVYASTPGDPWRFDTTVNTLVNPVDGTDYMLGTPSNQSYRTYSANSLSYATTTYIAYVYKAEDLKNQQPDQPVIPDTPVNPDDLVINTEEYYKSVLGLSGTALKQALRTLITSTHKKTSTYNDCKFELPYIDEDPNNTNNMILFYTGQSIKKSTDLTNDWNREHVWPQSLGWFKTSGAGADLHHIRPCNISVNSSRGNKKFGLSGGYYVPNDDYKGDIARIIFYLMVRYPEADNYSFTAVCEGVDTLLAWNDLDPVSALEMQRNDRVQEFQGNRNPFIDCADFADLIW